MITPKIVKIDFAIYKNVRLTRSARFRLRIVSWLAAPFCTISLSGSPREKDTGTTPSTRIKRHVSRSGRVMQTKHTEWKPTIGTGGKVVKLMPRQLKEMKKVQEKPDVVQSVPE